MISAWILRPDTRPERTEDSDRIVAALAEPSTRLWIDVLDSDETRFRPIAEAMGIEEESLQDCFSGNQRQRVEDEGEYVMAILYGALGVGSPPDYSPRKLVILCSERFVATIHERRLRTINGLLKLASKKPATFFARGIDFVLFRIIDNLVDNYVLCAESYEDSMNALHDASLDENVGPELLDELAPVQKELATFRRLVVAQREAVRAFSQGICSWLPDAIEDRFKHVNDHLTSVLEAIDSVREIAQTVRDNYNAMLAERTNRLMRVLTLFATMMLPVSFVAGFYGMNIPLWPPPEAWWTTVAVTGVMLAISGTMLYFFFRRRWL